MLNIFYEEPDQDRWIPFDRYPRRVVRQIVRGKPRPGGHMRLFLNLCAGLDRISVSYRVNDYWHARTHPDELACIVGKPCVLDKIEWKNPILLGAAVYSHPLDNPSLLEQLPIKKILVPGPWMKEMCKPYWGDAVDAWPVGIDTDLWHPSEAAQKSVDILLYDKVRWEHDRYEAILIGPIREMLKKRGYSFREMRYGFYREEEFHAALDQSRAMIFLCEHETQGIAYQQALSCNVPIFTWDRGGNWQDPEYYPDKVNFAPVTSVPYWDERCGRKFENVAGFSANWNGFWDDVEGKRFRAREYILENLTLEICAHRYVELANNVVNRTP